MFGKLSFIFVLSTWAVRNGFSEEIRFKRENNFNDIIKVNSPLHTEELQTFSMSSCAGLCRSNHWCSSFSFLPRKKCLLYEQVFAKPGGSQSSPGTRYFTAMSDACPSRDGYVWLRGPRMCIKVYPNFVNFTTAYRTCAKAGSRLAVLDKGDKLRGVAAYIADLVNPITQAFIGGMRDGAVNGTRTNWDSTLHPLYWLNGVKVPTSGPDSYWERPHLNPSNSFGIEGCMEIISGLWNDVMCYYTRAFICEKI